MFCDIDFEKYTKLAKQKTLKRIIFTDPVYLHSLGLVVRIIILKLAEIAAFEQNISMSTIFGKKESFLDRQILKIRRRGSYLSQIYTILVSLEKMI